MRLMKGAMVAIALVAIGAAGQVGAQQAGQDADRKVAGGGITAKGWQGMIDAGAAKKGATINDSKFAETGGTLTLTIGPAATYWNPANTAAGDYTVGATFREGKSDAGHPHSYGIFIGGNQLNTDQQSYVYCVAYGDGTFLVRGFNGQSVVTYSKRQPHAAVKKAGADGSVEQSIAWTVKGGRAECAINGTTVAGFDKSELVTAGKLESTDGIYGIRVSHNVNVTVSNFGKK